jgi:two-component system sensor histidine kinase BarA
VLAADDSAVNREVLSEALARLGIKVTLVENGRAAAEAAAASAFSLVFMDCSMPVMDGYQATRAIRAREAASGTGPVPIIALTAHVAGMHADAWREAGMNATLTKPFTLKSLGRCLEQWLDRSASAVRPDGYGTLKAASAHTPSQEPVAAPSSAAGGTLAAGQAPSVTDAIQDSAPVLDAAVLDEIRAMQDADDDLVGRIAGLYRLHAPAALDRLDTAVTEGSPDKIAETAHALKSLCRNIGAVRLGNRLNEIERNARSGTWHKEQCPLPTLAQELDLVLAGLPGPHASKLKRDTPDRAANAPGAGSGASASPGNARRNASRGAS